MKKTTLLATLLVMLGLGLLAAPTYAAGSDDDKCYETVVVKEAWVETKQHPAKTKTIHHPAVTETTPAVWANWAPNDTRGPQDYVPVWPEDERGTWIVHDQFPPGHSGPDGVYQQGSGNSPWFYRQAERTVVVEQAYDETVTVSEAWTETIDHPAVTKEREVDCDEEPKPPVTPEAPDKPEVKPDQIVVADHPRREARAVPAAVPTAVAAGLPATGAGDGTMLYGLGGSALLGAGALLLLAARRRLGAHQA